MEVGVFLTNCDIGWKKNFHQKSLLLLQLSLFVTAIGVDAKQHEEVHRVA